MNIDTIFTVKNEHLNRLDQKTSVEFFQKLLWAEARRLGVEISKINVSNWINVPDGGVDANVDDAQIIVGQGLIKQGKSSYQIKAGATFKPWQKSVIKEELFGTKDPGRQNLGESIQVCLDAEGTYILVCTGIDPTEFQRGDILSHIEEYLKLCGYSHPKFEVFTQNNLIGFLEFFPSLALRVNRNPGTTFQTHQSWSIDDTMRVRFFPSQSQKELIPKIQHELRGNTSAIHVRVLGEPGIGKTKLVLEATKVDDLSPLVIYCTASQFRDSDLMYEILRDDNHFSAILIIDECDPENRFYIWDKLQHRGPRIKLISIYNNHDPIAGSGITDFEIEHLEDEQILTIIQEYGVRKETADLYLQFCDGSPRMAQHTGKILADYPGDPSQLLTDDYLYKNFYIDFGNEEPNSSEVQQRELVLRHLALFKQFGFEGSLVIEAQAIAKKVEAANSQITWHRFQEIIDNLRKRKILQGGYTYYITPIALQIKLWVEWWQIYGNPFDYDAFIEDFPPKLIEWFNEMFRYASESEPALKIVEGHLGPNGPFQNSEYLNTRLGSSFFLTLTEAAPKSALKCLMQTIGSWNKESLLDFTEGRRNVVLALEKIAMHRDLFVDAARLLLALGEAENEGYSNNASGIFVELFSLGRGAVAPTEASPIERLPVLKEAFESESKERRKLALNACNKGLQSDYFTRSSGAGNQGLRGIPKLWDPKTYGEWWDAYRQIWQLLFEQLEYLPEDEREKVVEILLGRAGSIARIHKLSDMVVDTVRKITENRYAGKKQIIETISRILFHDDSYVDNKGLSPEIRQSFEKIRDELIGSDFHSLMQRYVGMDILEDHPLEDGVDKIKPHFEKLAKQSIDNPAVLESELSWLVTTEAQNGNKFGYELGKKDDNLSLLPTLLEAQRNADENASPYFLGGYFHAVFDRDLTLWEQQLDSLCEDTTLNGIVPYLTHCSGLTDQAGLRILKLVEDGIININDFGLFIYRNAITNLSVRVFKDWIELLLSALDRSSVQIALKLFYNYYISRKPEPTLPCELTFRLLSHPELFKESDNYGYDTMADFYWTKTANALLYQHPQKALELVQLMLVSFGNHKTMFNSFSQSCLFLTETTKKFPVEVWEYVTEYLGSQDNYSRTISIAKWLREADLSETEKEKGALTLIPPEKIWEWVDKDVENRAWYLASEFVPKTLLIEEWHGSLAQNILVRYGDREDVRSTLISNYSTEVFWGPASLHYENKIKKLVNIQNIDNEEKVNRWINEFVPFLEEQIEHAKIDEERRF